ncbi:CoA transferase subunit A [Acidaminobacter sp. JC074]|uniref:CoA transferase subunit A n=1 Tax=Acidaminobacter sp. JC074 TaxID=2530199 RepID=UPI001F117BA0|nr:CoA-transferase [Acidaminobacter sp. JC074]MCH4889019.1 CoA transferase subunit A [Acidaminobacter sp. JC074]
MKKVFSLKEAISKFVHDGDYIVFGGFTTNRKPYAAVHEIIRQEKKSLYIESGPAGGDMDMLIGVGACKAYINSYTANSGYSNVGRRFRKAIENKEILFEDYSLDVQPILYHAGSLGLPYVAVRHMLGSDLADKWGISEEERMKHDKLPNKKLMISENPFKPEEKLCLVPTPDIDVAIIHVQKASTNGIVRIEGSTIIDVDIALSARRCIVTCEELVEPEEMMNHSEMNQIPSFVTDAVVHVPYGAHPSQVYNYYDYDRDFLQMYDQVSRSDESFDEFINEWIKGLPDHEAYLDKLGVNRLVGLNVRKGLGYSVPSKA